MKNLLLLSIVLFVFGCSKSPENKARALIRQELKESLHDWDSYEIVKFGVLDSTYTSIHETPVDSILSLMREKTSRSSEIVEEIKRYAKYGQLFRRELLSLDAEIKMNTADMSILKQQADSICKSFVPEFIGWSMVHSFRANNLSGNKGIHHIRYYFDIDITQVLKHEDIGVKD